jgi:hypothetical protein
VRDARRVVQAAVDLGDEIDVVLRHADARAELDNVDPCGCEA